MNILTADNPQDKQLWIDLWKRIPDREVYAHPEYVLLYEDADNKAVCACIDNNSDIILFPFLMRNIPSQPYRDLISPYGYGGYLFCAKQPKLLLEQFNIEFQQWVIENNIISEFIRFYLNSPIIENYAGEIVHNNNNIIVDLTTSEEERWMTYKQKVRKNVKRALSSGVEVFDDEGENLDAFLDIYYDTMKRRDAKDNSYFPRHYFESIIANLSGQYRFFHAIFEGKIISTELILVSENNIYSFLGGTLDEYFQLRPNDYIKHKIMNWGRLNGKKAFVLGGGYTPNDGIFKYKEAFALEGITSFYVGRRIFNDKIYASLVDARKVNDLDFDCDSEFFPLYRA